MINAKAVKRFLSISRPKGPRNERLEIRCWGDQRAAWEAAAIASGDGEASAWARRVLDQEARRLLRSVEAA